MRLPRFARLLTCALFLGSGDAAGSGWAATPVQRAELDALSHAEGEGLEPVDYQVDRLNQLLQAQDDQAAGHFAAALDRAFARFARDLSQGRLQPSADPGWHLAPPAETGEVPLPAFASAAAVDAYLAQLVPPGEQYRRLRAELVRYLAIARAGGWPTVPAGADLHAGARDPRIVDLRNRLRISGHYTAQMQADPLYFDAGLDDALRRFQAEQGLWADGTLDERTLTALNVSVEARIETLKLTLERWRWLPRERSRRYVWVNIASQELAVIENEEPLLSMRVIVGRAYRQTPSLQGILNQITFNPTWTVPHKLAVEDLLPQQKRDPGFLARKRIRVFALRDGRELDPAEIDWSAITRRNFAYQLRQDAGPQNSLGHLKFSFDNPYDVYLHDTPSEVLFRLPTRTFSAGCVRIEDPILFARYLLSADRQMSAEDIQRAIDAGVTRTVTLRVPVPIYLVYLNAWAGDDGSLNLREDVYGRDRILAAAWHAETGRRRAELATP